MKEINKVVKTISREKTLLMIILLGLAMRLIFFVGPNMNDDIEYVSSAYQVSQGNFWPLYSKSIDSIRSMMILPISFFLFLFGSSELTASLWPLLTSILTIILTFLIGKLLFNIKIGLIASFFQAIFPLDIVWSTQLVPSIPMTFFLMVSILIFLIADKMSDNRKFLISGIFIGMCYLASELFFISFFFLFSYFIIFHKMNRKYIKRYILVLIGFLIIFLVEALFFFLTTKDPFHRIKVIHEEEIRVLTNTDLFYYPRCIFNIINPNFEAHEGNLGLFPFIFILGAFYGFYKRNKKIILFSMFVILSFLYLEFGIMTLTFKPIAKWIRYLVIFGPSMNLVSSNLIFEFRKKGLLIPIVIFIFITSLPFTANSSYIYNRWVSDFREMYKFLKELPEKPIYTDSGTHGYINLYFGFKRDIRLLENSRLEELKDCYVIVNGSLGAVTYQPMRDLLPDFAKNPPENWILLKTIVGNYDFYDPKIYHVP